MRASRWRQSAAAALKDGRNQSGAQLLSSVKHGLRKRAVHGPPCTVLLQKTQFTGSMGSQVTSLPYLAVRGVTSV